MNEQAIAKLARERAGELLELAEELTGGRRCVSRLSNEKTATPALCEDRAEIDGHTR